jgi:pilus assembly protein CpaF
MEALAALGGMDRPALHSQLAAAISVVIGVFRDSNGDRGVGEIGMLRRGADGLVNVDAVWRRRGGFTPAAADLASLLDSRLVR